MFKREHFDALETAIESITLTHTPEDTDDIKYGLKLGLFYLISIEQDKIA